ncbi:MAG TPA: cysteine synthase CysM [Leucothrix sp.]|nr:cysteine synthase CysM [Leucothrix sp.]HIQ15398.1 cysteine synthase CysM [Leucothrix sp.]
MKYPSIETLIGNTPLVKLQRMAGDTSNTILLKLEGNNPAGSVKDRAAFSMIKQAEENGDIKPGDTLIEATSGNTGIALAMVAAMRGYKMLLLMPDTMSEERRASMKAYGADLILVSKEDGGMEGARDQAEVLHKQGKGLLLDQFANPANSLAHYETTGPEIWRDTQGEVTHFVSAMGTTGTITGTGRYLHEKNKSVQIVGVQPKTNDEDIPGIRRWSAEYLPKIYDASVVDREIDITQQESEETMHRLATEEGIFCGVSSGGAVAAVLKLSQEIENATIVSIICDRGDRYISTGVFPA